MAKAFLVLAHWEFEGDLPLVVFGDRDKADKFSERCELYQGDEPDNDEDGQEAWEHWHGDHPAKPYLTHGEHLGGVVAFPVQELEMIAAGGDRG